MGYCLFEPHFSSWRLLLCLNTICMLGPFLNLKYNTADVHVEPSKSVEGASGNVPRRDGFGKAEPPAAGKLRSSVPGAGPASLSPHAWDTPSEAPGQHIRLCECRPGCFPAVGQQWGGGSSRLLGARACGTFHVPGVSAGQQLAWAREGHGAPSSQ